MKKWKNLKIDRNSVACVCAKMIFSSTNIMQDAPVKVLIRGFKNLHITRDLKKIILGNIMDRYVFKNQLRKT